MLQTLVVGLGSPRGDDQAAWKLVEMLGPSPHPGTASLPLREPSRLWDYLDGCQRLILIDACRSGRTAGTVLRLTWPDASIDTCLGRSTHGFSVGASLALADRLGRLPPTVVLFAIEAQTENAAEALSPAVTAALPGLLEQVLQEIRRQESGASKQ